MKTLFTFLLAASFSLAFAQQYPLQLFDTSSGKATGEVIIRDGAFEIVDAAFSSEKGGRILGVVASLQDGNLAINYRLLPPKTNQEYRIFVTVETERGGLLVIPPEYLKRTAGGLEAKKEGLQQIIWSDFVEQVFDPQGKIEITLTAELWGRYTPIDCSQPPVFSSREKLPYLITAGVGLAIAGTGLIFKRQSNDIYDNEYLPEPNQNIAQPFYGDANNKHHTFIVLTYLGLTTLAADAVLYLLRNSRHQQRLQLYQQFCSGRSLSLQPHFEIAPADQSYVGARLMYNF